MLRKSFRVGLRLGVLAGVAFTIFKILQSRRPDDPVVPPPARDPWPPVAAPPPTEAATPATEAPAPATEALAPATEALAPATEALAPAPVT
ncbi:MAG: hypothetical protein H0W70_05210, partial [Actinobacteria bacterium]|nr:hypothetical protein [Actinomycetota bacterium]